MLNFFNFKRESDESDSLNLHEASLIVYRHTCLCVTSSLESPFYFYNESELSLMIFNVQIIRFITL